MATIYTIYPKPSFVMELSFEEAQALRELFKTADISGSLRGLENPKILDDFMSKLVLTCTAAAESTG